VNADRTCPVAFFHPPVARLLTAPLVRPLEPTPPRTRWTYPHASSHTSWQPHPKHQRKAHQLQRQRPLTARGASGRSLRSQRRSPLWRPLELHPHRQPHDTGSNVRITDDDSARGFGQSPHSCSTDADPPSTGNAGAALCATSHRRDRFSLHRASTLPVEFPPSKDGHSAGLSPAPQRPRVDSAPCHLGFAGRALFYRSRLHHFSPAPRALRPLNTARLASIPRRQTPRRPTRRAELCHLRARAAAWNRCARRGP
jgi:hypothetical protein